MYVAVQGTKQGAGEELGWLNSEISQTSQAINLSVNRSGLIDPHMGQYLIIFCGKMAKNLYFVEWACSRHLEHLNKHVKK